MTKTVYHWRAPAEPLCSSQIPRKEKSLDRFLYYDIYSSLIFTYFHLQPAPHFKILKVINHDRFWKVKRQIEISNLGRIRLRSAVQDEYFVVANQKGRTTTEGCGRCTE